MGEITPLTGMQDSSALLAPSQAGQAQYGQHPRHRLPGQATNSGQAAAAVAPVNKMDSDGGARPVSPPREAMDAANDQAARQGKGRKINTLV